MADVGATFVNTYMRKSNAEVGLLRNAEDWLQLVSSLRNLRRAEGDRDWISEDDKGLRIKSPEAEDELLGSENVRDDFDITGLTSLDDVNEQ